MKQFKKAFTLIELLIVIGIIAILAAAVIITITPGERIESARESTRASHYAAIGTAFHITVIEDAYAGIGSILEETGCKKAVAADVFREFDNDCAEVVKLGTAPKDPIGTFYYIKSSTSVVGDTSARLIITTTQTSDLGEVTY